jgi:hypothetical protein
VSGDKLDALLELLLELDVELLLVLETELLLEIDEALMLEPDDKLWFELLAELGGVGSGCVFAIMVLTADQFPTASPALTP